MATIKTPCSYCGSTGCREEKSKACRNRAAKAVGAARDAEAAAKQAQLDAAEKIRATERQAAGAAARAAFDAMPLSVYTAEQFALAARVSDAQIAQTATFRAAQARGLYAEVETPAEAYRIERAADRAHEAE